MSQTTQCRLCLQTGADQKQLYDESGELNIEIFNKMKTFFSPKFLNKHMTVCLTCWSRIADFHEFLTNIYGYNEDISSHATSFKPQLADATSTYGRDDKSLLSKTFASLPRVLKKETPHEGFDTNQLIKKEQQFDDAPEEFEVGNLANTSDDYLVTNIKEEITIDETVVNMSGNLKPIQDSELKVAVRTQLGQKELNKIIAQWKSNLECGICQIPHSDFSVLSQHFSLDHPTVKPHIVCCKLKLISRRDIADHARFHSDPEAFKCHVCGKCNASGTLLYFHTRRIHSTDKKFACDVCNKSLRCASSLKEHMAIHTETSLYNCTACSSSFRYIGNLRRHLKSFHPEIRPEGNINRSEFEIDANSDKNQTSFLRTLRAPKNFDEIILQWKTNLECGVCKEPHTDFLTLKQHFSLQHPEQTAHIVCCHRKYAARYEIADHAKWHLNPEIFKCLECDYCFGCQRQLRAHTQRMHSSRTDNTSH